MEVLLGQAPRGQSGGTLAAAANEREAVRLEISQADSDLLSDTLNNTLIKWICEYNGLQPCMVSRTIKADEDLKVASETDANIAAMGYRLTLEGVKAKYGEHWELAPGAAPAPPLQRELRFDRVTRRPLGRQPFRQQQFERRQTQKGGPCGAALSMRGRAVGPFLTPRDPGPGSSADSARRAI